MSSSANAISSQKRPLDTLQSRGGGQAQSSTPMSESPEAQLLIACARTVVDSSTSAQIRSLLKQKLDWRFVFQKAHQNAIVPLVCWNLLKAHADLIPSHIAKQLSQFFESHARHNLKVTRELISLLQLFEKSGVQALAFKGPLLAANVYRNLSLRQYGDLDILVHKRDLVKVTELLTANGYELVNTPTWFEKLPTPISRKKDLGFVKKEGHIVVELHWRLSGTHFNLPLNSNHLWNRLETLSLGGTDVRNLPADILLLYLCTHGSRHGWARLEWISDVAELLRVYPDLDWDSVFEQAHILGVERILALGLFLAHDLLGSKLPDSIRQKVNADELVMPLAAHVRQWLFHDENASWGLSSWYKHHLGMKERARDRLSLHMHYYFRYLRVAVRPNSRDYSLLILPNYLTFVYYLLRPIRLTNQYIWLPLKNSLSSHKRPK